MEYSAQFTYDCLWCVDGEKRVCTGGHESDGYPCLTCKTHIPKLLYLINRQIKSKNYTAPSFYPYSPVLLILSISVQNLVTIGRHAMSLLTSATFNMLKYSDIYDI